MTDQPAVCEGPLVWFGVLAGGALLECACCGYLVVSGSLFDRAHTSTPLLSEGLAA